MKSDYGKKSTATFENIPQEQWDKIFNRDNRQGSGSDIIQQDNLLGSCKNKLKTGITDEAPTKGISNGY